MPPSLPSSSRSRCLVVHRAHRPAWIRPVCPQPGQVRQNPGSGRVQAAQSGSVLEPPRTLSVFPHREHRAQRCLQASHHGWPVVLDR